MFHINPYRPGAGMMPTYLAGRDNDIYEVEQLFKAMKAGIPVQSVIFSGLRGVGKTVLINKLQRKAEENGIFCKYIEIEEKNDFISQIAACSQSFLRSASMTGKLQAFIETAMLYIKSLVISFDPSNNSFSLSTQERDLYSTNNLTQSLTDVFTSIGEIASKIGTPICFFVDEIQYMKQKELGSLIAALHRSNQLGYPIMIIGAGLPKVFKMLSDEKTYSERLFIYKEIDSLDSEQAKKAITIPAEQVGVKYTDDAVNEIVSITKGYPFFIQQFCEIIFKNSASLIEESDVIKCVDDFYKKLDSGFFKVRYERCSDSEKSFIFAMVSCGELPCTTSNIASKLQKPVNGISPARAQLIAKGIIYPVKHGKLDFTVPQFEMFIKRSDEYNAWLK